MATLKLSRRHMEVLYAIVQDHMVSEMICEAEKGEAVARAILTEIGKSLRLTDTPHPAA